MKAKAAYFLESLAQCIQGSVLSDREGFQKYLFFRAFRKQDRTLELMSSNTSISELQLENIWN